MTLKSRLASQSSIIFAARIIGAGITFIVQAGIARFWGSEILGNYMLIMAMVNLLIVFMPLGFQTIGTYFVSEYRAKKDKKMLKHFIWRSYLHIAIMAIIFALIISPCCLFLGRVGEIVANYWIAMIIIAVAGAIIYVNSAILVGLKKPFAAFFTDALFRPILVLASLAFVTVFFAQDEKLYYLFDFMAVSFMIIAILQLTYLLISVKQVDDVRKQRKKETSRWWRFALPWVLIALATDYFFDIDLIILSNFLNAHDLAIFGVSARIFTLAAFGIAAVYAVCLPDIFESEANNDRDGFLQKVGEANQVAALLSFIMLIGISILGYFVLKIFGDDFTLGLVPLIILCSALFIRSIFGPASMVLSIYDRPYASLPAVFLGLLSLFILNYLLVPNFALMGAALAALGAITIWSFTQWLVALKIAKIDISIFPYIKQRILAFT